MAGKLFKGNNRIEVSYGVYGMRPSGKFHYGIDVDTTDSDKNVYATIGGICTESAIYNKPDVRWGFGNFVRIKDTSGLEHYYAHLANRAVKKGDKVSTGQAVGLMGQSGNAGLDAQAEHVHYEVRTGPYENSALNPAAYAGIPNKQGVYDGFDSGIGYPVDRDPTAAQVEVTTTNLRARNAAAGEVLGYIKQGIYYNNGETLKDGIMWVQVQTGLYIGLVDGVTVYPAENACNCEEMKKQIEKLITEKAAETQRANRSEKKIERVMAVLQ